MSPRFLPEFDNAVLSHAERCRIVRARPGPGYPLRGDGFYTASWKLDGATITVTGAAPDDALVEEGLRLLELRAPGAGSPRVEFA